MIARVCGLRFCLRYAALSRLVIASTVGSIHLSSENELILNKGLIADKSSLPKPSIIYLSVIEISKIKTL